MAPAKCIDKNDDDVPVSILRVRTVGPDSRLRRASKKRGLSITDPSRTVKRAAVGYKAAKEGAEFIKAEIKGQQNMRNRAPVARQCAEYVLEQIQAVPDHVWFAEPVDLERDGCPDYLEIIHHPLDLKIIQSRMTEGRYDAPESFYAKFVSDIRRIFDNATAYNYDADHVVHLGAKRCLGILEIILRTASDALAAAITAKETSGEAAGQHAERSGRRAVPCASKKIKIRALLSGMAAGGDLIALVQNVCGSFKAVPSAIIPTGVLGLSQPHKDTSKLPANTSLQLTEKRPPKVARLRKDASEAERIAAMLVALSEYISSCGGDGNHVLSTFSATIEVRKEGSTAGTSDIYYYDDSGRRFRSRAEVARALGLVPLTGGPGRKPRSGDIDRRCLKMTEASRQRAKRLELKLEKALDKYARRMEAFQRDRRVDDSILDSGAAPDLEMLGRPIDYAEIDSFLSVKAGDFSNILATWHFLNAFSIELGIGISHNEIYDDKSSDDCDEVFDTLGAMRPHKVIVPSFVLDPWSWLDASSTMPPCRIQVSIRHDNGFLRRVHCAIIRLLLSDPTANLWWPNSATDDQRAPVVLTVQPPAAPSEVASRRLSVMAARVKLDTEAVLKCDADEPEKITKRWLEMLEGIRHLKTNSGNPIRDGILARDRDARNQAVLETTTNAAVKHFLRRCLTWWRCNAAGTTKHGALQVLDLMRIQKPALLNVHPYPTSSNCKSFTEVATPTTTAAVSSSVSHCFDEHSAQDEDTWNFTSQVCGRYVLLPFGGDTGVVVATRESNAKILVDRGARCGSIVVETLGNLSMAEPRLSAQMATRFLKARALHADVAIRPLKPHTGCWDACASAIAVRLAVQDDAVRSSSVKGPGAIDTHDIAAVRDRTIGDVHHKLSEPFAWCDTDTLSVDPLVAATDKLRCGGTYDCLAVFERAALLDALIRGAMRLVSIASTCDARVESWKMRERNMTEARESTKETKLKRRDFHESKARSELEARARLSAEDRRKESGQNWNPGSSEPNVQSHAVDHLAVARAEICSDDKVRRRTEQLADACACGCGPHEELILCSHDHVRNREATMAAMSDCEASALFADRVSIDNDAAIAHLYARQARDNLHALRRHALESLEHVLDVTEVSRRNKLVIEAGIQRCEDAQFASKFPSESNSQASRWVLDLLRKGYLTLRDVRDALTNECAEKRARIEILNMSQIRGCVLGVDRLRRTYVSLECGLDHDARVWCLPRQQGFGPWYQIEGSANLQSLQSRLGARGARESLLQAELAVFDFGALQVPNSPMSN
ncbi:hypothetical protein AURANDRAFT_72724 [Aureococcus anophagefferens]|uniref:Bromo domain-containing protein n=1 Tax=Aureococcus anophagefferens TaxID=44056 RepID=F0YN94_AURAN|nr:hypothetical protein AURANDRAFT_72724 [Aureococcus anophagefferens]EGB03425.1 hypothetical protein AURANDRAFT_72724 [Aureococcus anophagefferens]|eukprot:XP_009041896.1 hypothetical protein AURANDRAFT_72724 [Aureococcus anophagefferens]